MCRSTEVYWLEHLYINIIDSIWAGLKMEHLGIFLNCYTYTTKERYGPFFLLCMSTGRKVENDGRRPILFEFSNALSSTQFSKFKTISSMNVLVSPN